MMPDPRPSWQELAIQQNESLKSRVFHTGRFESGKFLHSDQCRMCGQRIGPAVEPGIMDEGFVTQMTVQYVGLPVSHFWAWVCAVCFEAFQEEMKWTVAEGEAPDLPMEEVRAFSRAWNARIRAQRRQDPGWLDKHPFCHTGWSADDVVGLAQLNGFAISREEAQSFLEVNEGTILSAMNGGAAQAIVALLRREKRDSRK